MTGFVISTPPVYSGEAKEVELELASLPQTPIEVRMVSERESWTRIMTVEHKGGLKLTISLDADSFVYIGTV